MKALASIAVLVLAGCASAPASSTHALFDLLILALRFAEELVALWLLLVGVVLCAAGVLFLWCLGFRS